ERAELLLRGVDPELRHLPSSFHEKSPGSLPRGLGLSVADAVRRAAIPGSKGPRTRSSARLRVASRLRLWRLERPASTDGPVRRRRTSADGILTARACPSFARA